MRRSVVPAPLERSGMAGAAFRPFTEAMMPSEVYCAWQAAADLPAREGFVEIVVERR